MTTTPTLNTKTCALCREPIRGGFALVNGNYLHPGDCKTAWQRGEREVEERPGYLSDWSMPSKARSDA